MVRASPGSNRGVSRSRSHRRIARLTPGPHSLLLASLATAARRFRDGIFPALNRGNRVACPVCDGRFRHFIPGGVVRRANARCPACGSLERHRLLWLYLGRRTDLFTVNRRVLHVAPEPPLARRLSSLANLDYVSIDLESPRAMMKMDATRLAFPDRWFDLILCFHVLEHIPDDRAAMREFLRVLNPGGRAILQSPFDPARAETYEDSSVTSPEARERAFGQRDHVRIYGRDYVARLRGAGFAVEECSLARELPEEETARFGVLADETLTVCRRLTTA
jgi:SAM-dependent methyltransferase